MKPQIADRMQTIIGTLTVTDQDRIETVSEVRFTGPAERMRQLFFFESVPNAVLIHKKPVEEQSAAIEAAPAEGGNELDPAQAAESLTPTVNEVTQSKPSIRVEGSASKSNRGGSAKTESGTDGEEKYDSCEDEEDDAFDESNDSLSANRGKGPVVAIVAASEWCLIDLENLHNYVLENRSRGYYS
jgi:hypothetical protein